MEDKYHIEIAWQYSSRYVMSETSISTRYADTRTLKNARKYSLSTAIALLSEIRGMHRKLLENSEWIRIPSVHLIKATGEERKTEREILEMRMND
ncbi:hypothetical protein KAR91_57875 [Candidatus Pacearchaeota archaeon]|nr:hypothetical protein [Candidatus Pacearchaeota archaeon]